MAEDDHAMGVLVIVQGTLHPERIATSKQY